MCRHRGVQESPPPPPHGFSVPVMILLSACGTGRHKLVFMLGELATAQSGVLPSFLEVAVCLELEEMVC